MKRCDECLETFKWDDQVVNVEGRYFHGKCVTLYPTGYIAFLDDEFLGETENEGGQMAFEVLRDGEFMEGDSDE